MSAPKTMPPALGGPIPYLQLSDAAVAADFYAQAFGAEIAAKMPPDDKGRYMHIHLYVNGGSLMLCDPFPEYGHGLEKPQAFTLHLQIDDIDAWFKRAVEAGAEIVQPVELAFWGDRYGQLRDPFGVLWSMGQHV